MGFRLRAGAVRSVQRPLDALPQGIVRLLRRRRPVQGAQPLPPCLDIARERRIFRHEALGMLEHVAFQGAHGELGRQQILLFGLHPPAHPRHSLRAIRLRRTQALAVPIGTPNRPASSAWVKPWT